MSNIGGDEEHWKTIHQGYLFGLTSLGWMLASGLELILTSIFYIQEAFVPWIAMSLILWISIAMLSGSLNACQIALLTDINGNPIDDEGRIINPKSQEGIILTTEVSKAFDIKWSLVIGLIAILSIDFLIHILDFYFLK